MVKGLLEFRALTGGFEDIHICRGFGEATWGLGLWVWDSSVRVFNLDLGFRMSTLNPKPLWV